MQIDIRDFEKILDCLEFYAANKNYWSMPLPLENNYCRRTLHDVREAEKHNAILSDQGHKARNILCRLENICDGPGYDDFTYRLLDDDHIEKGE
jgi:hypothetical protein